MKKIIFLSFIFIALILVTSSSKAACVNLTECKTLYSDRVQNKIDSTNTAINSTINSYDNINTQIQDDLIADWQAYQDNQLTPLLTAISNSTSESALFDLINSTDVTTTHVALIQSTNYHYDANQIVSNIQDSYTLINETFDYVIGHTRASSYQNSLSLIPIAYAAKGDPKTVCGDSIVDKSEECDDPNDVWCTSECNVIYLDDDKTLKGSLDGSISNMESEQSSFDAYIIEIDTQLTAITRLDLSSNVSLSTLQSYQSDLDVIRTNVNNAILQLLGDVENIITL